MSMKKIFLEKLEPLLKENKDFKILDLGCGQSRNFLFLFEKFPQLHYLGIEPNPIEASIASSLLADYPNAKVLNQLAYDKPIGHENERFDLCISLSVLEHVKQLERFLKNSVDMVKTGGQIIHLYDLGHSIHSSSIKEKFQVFLGNNLPWLLSEKKYVSYVDQNNVIKILEASGAQVEKITYHQMPSHKLFVKYFPTDTLEKKELVNRIFDWEFEVSKYMPDVNREIREKMFPSVCIWARKK